MTIKKSLFRHWPLIPNFFIAYLSILVWCKTKGAVGAVWAAFGGKVERVPGCREDILFFSNLLGFAGRLLAKFLMTAVLAAGVSLHVKLSCCPSRFVSRTNLAIVPFTRHSIQWECPWSYGSQNLCCTVKQCQRYRNKAKRSFDLGIFFNIEAKKPC